MVAAVWRNIFKPRPFWTFSAVIGGPVNRRVALGGVAGLGMAVVAGRFLGKPPADPVLLDADAKPKRGAPHPRGQHIHLDRRHADPAHGALNTDYVRHFMLYSGLTELDRHLNAQPALAQSLTSADQQVWHVTLRRGVTFTMARA
jgi:peptide/nickel transport system substrate-binding protein